MASQRGLEPPAPFFDSTPTAPGESVRPKRALLISYHFPPDPAVGGLRWQELARYFVDNGWSIDVITRDMSRVKQRNDERLRRLPSHVRIYSVSERDPIAAKLERAALALVRRVQRAEIAAPVTASASNGPAASSGPAARAGLRAHLARALSAWVHLAGEKLWARAAARIGAALARHRVYHVVISSGPPHMAHEAARRVAKAVAVPLVIDFRDPWTGIERLAEGLDSPVWFAVAKRYERAAVRDARLVVMNTDPSRDYMRQRYPSASARTITVRNGSDDEQLPVVPRSSRFTIRFAGSIYLDRDPRNFFRAAARAVQRLRLTPADFGLDFMGQVELVGEHSVGAMAKAEGIGEFVTIQASQPREAAMRFLAGATMLLNLPQDLNRCVPAKIFEYVRFDAWQLILAVKGSATAKTLEGSNADVVEPDDVDQIAAVIEARYLQHARGERPFAPNHDGRFDRNLQARILLDQVQAVTNC